jgi:2-dehydropantoate 2-reductase
MKIAVIGAGAMGSLFGGRLSLSGHEVAMVDVSPTVIDAISDRGLAIEDDNGQHLARPEACRAEDLEGPVDLIMLFTKTMHSRAAMESARGAIGPETEVLSLQNGLGNIELIARLVPVERILAGVTRVSSDLVAPGRVRSHGGGYTKIARVAGGTGPMLEAVLEALAASGFEAERSGDIQAAIWEKAAFNAAINATSAVCRTSCGPVGTAEGRALCLNIAREAVTVARAWGVEASESAVVENLLAAFSVHHDHVTSMAQDVLAKRATEIEAINGQILQKARAKGLQAPYNEALYCLIRVIEDSWTRKIGAE